LLSDKKTLIGLNREVWKFEYNYVAAGIWLTYPDTKSKGSIKIQTFMKLGLVCELKVDIVVGPNLNI
jgi:hypothetical protein